MDVNSRRTVQANFRISHFVNQNSHMTHRTINFKEKTRGGKNKTKIKRQREKKKLIKYM